MVRTKLQGLGRDSSLSPYIFMCLLQVRKPIAQWARQRVSEAVSTVFAHISLLKYYFCNYFFYPIQKYYFLSYLLLSKYNKTIEENKQFIVKVEFFILEKASVIAQVLGFFFNPLTTCVLAYILLFLDFIQVICLSSRNVFILYRAVQKLVHVACFLVRACFNYKAQ